MFHWTDVDIFDHEGDALAYLVFAADRPVREIVKIPDSVIRLTGGVAIRKQPAVVMPIVVLEFGDELAVSWCFNGNKTRQHMELLSSQDTFVVAMFDRHNAECRVFNNPPQQRESLHAMLRRVRSSPTYTENQFQEAATEFHSQFDNSHELADYLKWSKK